MTEVVSAKWDTTMTRESEEQMELLSNSSEEEFGKGSELPTTDFVVFGLLTFWIYTVWRYWDVLDRHIRLRLDYFKQRLSRLEVPGSLEQLVTQIVDDGFMLKQKPKYISIALYAISMSLLISLLGYKSFTGHLNFYTDLLVVGVAAVSFCGSSIFFMSFVCKSLKAHEYNELLLYRLVRDPDNFKRVQPSNQFIRRWNTAQNWIAFFLVLSIPITLSPIVGVYHFYSSIERGFIFSDVVSLGWIVTLLVLGAVFHIGGSEILIRMYNGHMRIEQINREIAEGRSVWMPKGSESVIGRDGRDSELPSSGTIPERMLAAIMITDMVGFSAEMESREETAYLKLQKHNDIIRSNIAKSRGEEIKTMGDAFLIRYGSAVDAVKAAIAVQRDFSAYNQDKDEELKIHVRIGIHIGDVLIMGKDVIGNGVNVASRIQPLAEPGGVCISADIYNIVKKSIDIKAVSLGRQELKNISEAPEIYRIIFQSVQNGV
jgi:class 3 adenylate cyclase